MTFKWFFFSKKKATELNAQNYTKHNSFTFFKFRYYLYDIWQFVQKKCLLDAFVAV